MKYPNSSTDTAGAKKFSAPVFLWLPLLLGGIHTLSYAPLEWWWLQAISLGGLFMVMQSAASPQSVWRAALPGLLFGLGWFGSGVSWVYISMHTYGQMPAPVAALATLLFCLFLALFPALAVGIWRRYFQSSGRWAQALSFAACWALAEWVRGFIFTGFPWISTGSAHVIGPLRGFVPILGVIGVGFLAALSAVWLVQSLQAYFLRQTRSLIQHALLCSVLILVGWGLTRVPWTTPLGQPLQVRLLQGNIGQDLKFQAEHQQTSFIRYAVQTMQAPADVIVWPEVALPRFWHEIDAEYLRGLRQFSEQTQSHLLLGVPFLNADQTYTNSVLQIAPSRALNHSADQSIAPANVANAESATMHRHAGRYDKQHLVPFGEFIPWGFRWFVDMMQIPLGDFARGDLQQKNFTVKDQRLALNICYEDLFGEEILYAVRRAPNEAATILVNVSNIAWFGDSLAIAQHLQASRMRALETGRPMLRATNTGTTAVIRADGVVQAALPAFQEGVLTATVQGRQGMTPYVRWGNVPMVSLLSVLLLWAAIQRVRHKTIKIQAFTDQDPYTIVTSAPKTRRTERRNRS